MQAIAGAGLVTKMTSTELSTASVDSLTLHPVKSVNTIGHSIC